MEKGAITYVTEGEGQAFTSTVTGVAFTDAHVGQGTSKKAAEDAAAKVALQKEFPESWEKVKKMKPGAPQKGGGNFQQIFQAMLTANQGGWAAEGDSDKVVEKCAKMNSWRSRLVCALSDKVGSSNKDDLAFETTKQEEGGGFKSALSSPHFKEVYTSSRRPQKGQAEESASKIAFHHEFGWIFAKLPAEVQHQKAGKGATIEEKKAKRESGSAAPANPKQELQRGISLVLGRPAGKEDIVFSMVEEAGKLTPTLKCKVANGQTKVYKGTPIATDASKEARKAAEADVAQKGVTANKAAFKAKFAEADRKKEAQKKANLERVKRLQEEKKAAKAAKTA